MSILVFAVALSAFKPLDEGQLLRRELERTLQGVRLHGHHYRALALQAIHRTTTQGNPEGDGDDRYLFTYPTGWSSAAIITTIGWGYSMLLYNQGGKIHVDRLQDPDYENLLSAFWSDGALFIVRSHDGSASSWTGDVLRKVGANWRIVNRLCTRCELRQDNAAESSVEVIKDHPLVVDINVDERSWDGQHIQGSHFSPMPRFFEHWQFANGRLRRVEWREANAIAELDKLIDLRFRGRRAAFDARVPSRLRRRLWSTLQYFYQPQVLSRGKSAGDEASMRLRVCKSFMTPGDVEFDKSRGFSVHDLLLNFEKRRGRYVVTWMQMAPAKPGPW